MVHHLRPHCAVCIRHRPRRPETDLSRRLDPALARSDLGTQYSGVLPKHPNRLAPQHSGPLQKLASTLSAIATAPNHLVREMRECFPRYFRWITGSEQIVEPDCSLGSPSARSG